MARDIGYDRKKALDYAKKWAFARNPAYYDFEHLGGDCTNYASQCLFAGCGVMNYTPVHGWYYIDANNRTASWTGVRFLYEFLMRNTSAGPYGKLVPREEIIPGDLVQLGDGNGRYYHTPVVVDVKNGEIFVAAHTIDSYMRTLRSYSFHNIRYIHIIGARA